MEKLKKFLVRQIPKDHLLDFKAEAAAQGVTMNQAYLDLMDIYSHHRQLLLPHDIVEVLRTTHTVLGEMFIENKIEDEDNILKNLHKRMFRIIRKLEAPR